MKKTCFIFLPLAMLALQLQAQITYETFRAELEKNYQKSRNEVHMRDSVPVLYIDTAHCVGYTFFPSYQLSDESFDGYTYDAQNREIESRRRQIYYQNNVESNTKINSTYDSEGRLSVQISSNVDDFGQATPYSKTEFGYDAEDRINLVTSFSWTGTNWIPVSRELRQYDALNNLSEGITQSYDGFNWVNASKYNQVFDANGNLLQIESSEWLNGNWNVTYLYVAVFDIDGNLQEETSSFGFNGDPLEPASRSEFFNTNGVVDSIYRYFWNSPISAWELSEKEVRVYNASGEWIESYYLDYNAGQFSNYRRELYEEEENPFPFPIRTILSQNWDPLTMNYLDASETIYDFEVLPGNRALGSVSASSQNPPGSGTWLLNFFCDLGYRFNYVTGTKHPADADALCSMPNPYTTGQWIQCDQLRDNYTYMAQVFSLDGRRVYARAFKGGEGWSIERQLPEGLYVVVLTHNDKPVWKSKVVVRN